VVEDICWKCNVFVAGVQITALLAEGKIYISRTLKIIPDPEVNEPLVHSVDLKFHFNIILKEFKNKPFVSISNLFHETQNNMRYFSEHRIVVVGVCENLI
jgi:hypothetical protein